ncbi:MAG: hypothetical protein ACI31C_01785 [Muribaculaceae bacterium]
MMPFLTACNDDDEPQTSFLIFATYSEATSAGSVFTAQRNLDSPLVTYTTSVVLDGEHYKVGNRYIINFTNATNSCYESGPITLLYIVDVCNGSITEASSEEIADVSVDPLEFLMIQREGHYINVQAVAYVNIQPTLFNMYVDRATINNEVPDVYFGFKSDVISSQKQLFGSFDIASVWDLPTCKGICIHYKANNENKTLTFSKEQ